jgi:hypothetical protein
VVAGSNPAPATIFLVIRKFLIEASNPKTKLLRCLLQVARRARFPRQDLGASNDRAGQVDRFESGRSIIFHSIAQNFSSFSRHHGFYVRLFLDGGFIVIYELMRMEFLLVNEP